MVHVNKVDITQFWEIQNVHEEKHLKSQNVNALNISTDQRSETRPDD